jgi:uncharacterized protein
VDEAGVISIHGKMVLENMLKSHENKTGNQVVVAVLRNLGGEDISEYGYQLGRHWGIGQKDKNNGLILLIAMEEKKIRIDVGYGLEGLMTDAKSKYIIENIIKPQFKARNMENGILQGIVHIVQVLENADGLNFAEKKSSRKKGQSDWLGLVLSLLFIFFVIIRIFSGRNRFTGGRYYGGGGFGGFGGYSGGGGFSGGGGSFGGGGASGNW